MTDYSTSGIGFAVNVTSIAQVEVTPVRRNVVNKFDSQGNLLTVDRLPVETNAEFRQRMLDMSVHRGDPTYEGLINNLSRAFGCPRYHALTIDLTVGSDGSPLAPRGRVDILADRVVLYSDWQSSDTYTIDAEINIYDLGADGFYLNELVNEINSSQYFTASIQTGVRSNIHSSNLVRGTSYNSAVTEYIYGHTQHKFQNTHIIPETLWFSEEKNVFTTEVSTEPAADGEYYVDYINSYVVTYNIPSGEGICGYAWNDFPMKVDASLVHAYSFQDENFTKKLFHQEQTDAGDVNGLPNKEGAEIFHQLYKEANIFWGE